MKYKGFKIENLDGAYNATKGEKKIAHLNLNSLKEKIDTYIAKGVGYVETYRLFTITSCETVRGTRFTATNKNLLVVAGYAYSLNECKKLVDKYYETLLNSKAEFIKSDTNLGK